jgi:hypothetical protein
MNVQNNDLTPATSEHHVYDIMSLRTFLTADVILICIKDADVISCFNLHNPSSRTKALGLTLTTTVYQESSRGKVRQARKADNFAAFCERIV